MEKNKQDGVSYFVIVHKVNNCGLTLLMPVPEKHLARKDEITTDFLKLAEQYVSGLAQGHRPARMHTSTFAAALFIAPRHLTNTIKLTTGKSPCEILEEQITAAAQHMLSHTGMPVTGIAERFAYGEATNFVKFFKGMTGITPLQYRKRMQAAAESA